MDATPLDLGIIIPDSPPPTEDRRALEMAELVDEIQSCEERLSDLYARRRKLMAYRVLNQGWSWSKVLEEAHVTRPTLNRAIHEANGTEPQRRPRHQ